MRFNIGMPIAVIISAVLLWGCGGGKSTSLKPRGDGNIYLTNRSQFRITASYYNDELGKVETAVDPNKTEDVSKALLKAGTKVSVHVISDREYTGEPFKPERDIEITIDGSITIIINQVGRYGNPGAWQFDIVKT